MILSHKCEKILAHKRKNNKIVFLKIRKQYQCNQSISIFNNIAIEQFNASLRSKVTKVYWHLIILI